MKAVVLILKFSSHIPTGEIRLWLRIDLEWNTVENPLKHNARVAMPSEGAATGAIDIVIAV
ncbi:hypothetical protein T265_00109 [Opisthorchis viverrini]|uniref:Uncharacterized protein n=1 Tax=Opisthorchis viverrini TaxID=6198 RepID=A0A075AJZ8_OPIVI|nr:hypothetical protein T265_00109 [Opisthorchis viverrini]KER34259.1 hypothetical protein T265_00109 [Opisthorchis viverrini]